MQADGDVPKFVEQGFNLAYGKDAGDFRFNVMAVLTVLAFGLYAASGYAIILIIAAATGCTAYFFYPLKERKPRIGGGEYGVFIDGFGLISWRAINDIKIVTYANRFNESDELQFFLKVPLDRALLVDWRRLPIWRLLMKLPWTMTHDNVIRIPFEPFEVPAEDVLRHFMRLWKYYR